MVIKNQTTIYRTIGSKEKVITHYGTNYITIENIFDLSSEEIKNFIEKKDNAPEGSLRDFYQTQSNRGLISKIARHGVKIILWEVINGKSFYFPKSKISKIFIGTLDEKIARQRRKIGLYKSMNLYMTNFKIPQIQMYIGDRMKHNCCIYANRDFYYRISGLVNEKGHVGGKIPFRLNYVLEKLYDEFSFIKRSCIKLIMQTFIRRLVLVMQKGGTLVVKDNDHFIKFYYPRSIKKHAIFSERVKNRILKHLEKDKEKYFLSWDNKAKITLQS